MIRNSRLTCVVAALAISALFPSLTRAEIGHYRAQAVIASANFLEIDPTGCIWTYADLSVTEGRIRNEPGLGPPSTGLVLYIHQSDYCDGNYLTEYDLSAWTSIPADAFVVQGALRSASVQVTVDVENRWTRITQPAVINVTWIGDGDILRGHSNSQSTFPGGRNIWQSSGVSRTATPSGSIVLQSMTLTGTDGVYGRLESDHSTYLSIFPNR